MLPNGAFASFGLKNFVGNAFAIGPDHNGFPEGRLVSTPSERRDNLCESRNMNLPARVVKPVDQLSNELIDW